MSDDIPTVASLLAENKFSEALQHINERLENDDNNIILLNQKSLLEKKLGKLEEAERSLQRAIEVDPNYAASYNNLGSLYFAQGKFKLAEQTFKTALNKQKNYIDALYNLALCHKAQNKIEDCGAALKTICDINPRYIPAHFLWAKTLLEKKETIRGCERLVVLANISENAVPVLTEIVKLLLDHDRFLEAEPFCLQLLKEQGRDYRLLYNLGVINEKKRDIQNAISYYLKAIDIKPDSFEALNNLGVLYLETQQVKTAKFYLQKANLLQPNNKPLQHTLSAISGDKKIDHASNEYITSLFDQYADNFEDHLLTALEYKLPELLKLQIARHLSPKEHSLSVLDLGCGTGLLGKEIKHWCNNLIGVDLSKKMLVKAHAKNIYDELICDDMLDVLNLYAQFFDLITASDVFVYNGNLDAIFCACKKALKQNSWLCFSLEITDGEDYFLAKSGRFHHSHSYIETLIKKYNFTLVGYQQANTRMQHNEPAVGGLYLLQS